MANIRRPWIDLDLFTVMLLAFLLVLGLVIFGDYLIHQDYGTVNGIVTVGPLCPVEPCNRTLDLSGYSLAFTTNGIRYSYAPLSVNGHFSVSLLSGVYYVTMTPSCPWAGCGRSFPLRVSVVAGQTTSLNISIDTGIR